MKLDVAAVVLDLEGNLMRAVEYDTNGDIIPEQPVTIPEQCDHHYDQDSCSISMRGRGAVMLQHIGKVRTLYTKALDSAEALVDGGMTGGC